MRGDKPLSLLHGQPLIRHALRLIEELPVQERIVVVGHQAEKLFPLLAGLPVWSIYNPDFLQGIGHSIAAGIRIASQQVEAYMVLLADMPLLRSEPIIAMMDAFCNPMSQFGSCVQYSRDNPGIRFCSKPAYTSH